MAHNNPPQHQNDIEDDFDEEDTDDESIASLETDDGQEHPPERILAQLQGKNNFTWYLVKWRDCPLLRSSWEGKDIFANHPWIFDAWQIELQRQVEGLSKPFDIVALDKAVALDEEYRAKRRVLRRLRRRLKRVLSMVATT